jgi:hypothetical protein
LKLHLNVEMEAFQLHTYLVLEFWDVENAVEIEADG